MSAQGQVREQRRAPSSCGHLGNGGMSACQARVTDKRWKANVAGEEPLGC